MAERALLGSLGQSEENKQRLAERAHLRSLGQSKENRPYFALSGRPRPISSVRSASASVK